MRKKLIVIILLLVSLNLFCRVIDLKPSTINKSSIFGIDISHHNKIYNWSNVGNNFQFCIIKATEGKSFKDPKFNSYWTNSKKIGLVRGAYHFFQPNVPAEKQFNNFKQTVKLSKGDLPPVLDVELKECNIGEVNKWLYLAEKHYKVKPIVYSEYLFFKVYLDGRLADYPIWIYINERYKSQPSFNNYNCILWQYSHQGSTKGIKGDVDLNKFLGTQNEFEKLLIKN